jgi:hypothetical protein
MRRLVQGDETLDKRATTMLEPFRRHDLFLYTIKGGPGLGDPLERDPGDIQRDLDDRIVTAEFAARVYGAVVDGTGERFVVDAVATAARRDELRETRARRAMPAREWVVSERERVLARDVIAPVAEMYRSSFDISPDWARDYRAFWNLDEGFTY